MAEAIYSVKKWEIPALHYEILPSHSHYRHKPGTTRGTNTIHAVMSVFSCVAETIPIPVPMTLRRMKLPTGGMPCKLGDSHSFQTSIAAICPD